MKKLKKKLLPNHAPRTLTCFLHDTPPPGVGAGRQLLAQAAPDGNFMLEGFGSELATGTESPSCLLSEPPIVTNPAGSVQKDRTVLKCSKPRALGNLKPLQKGSILGPLQVCARPEMGETLRLNAVIL